MQPGDPEADPKSFFFDFVFGKNCTQKEIYDACASSVVESVLDGYNGTIFAYGQVSTKIVRVNNSIIIILKPSYCVRNQ